MSSTCVCVCIYIYIQFIVLILEHNEAIHRKIYLCVSKWVPYHYFMADTGFAVGENGYSDVCCDFVYIVLGTLDCRQGVVPHLGNWAQF